MAPARLLSSDEIKREAPSGIDVLVVGAGLGGLFAAIELYRQGHDVRIIESKPRLEALGSLHPRTPFGHIILMHGSR